jgi:hypothetical protein
MYKQLLDFLEGKKNADKWVSMVKEMIKEESKLEVKKGEVS